jgi:hypothetical protein
MSSRWCHVAHTKKEKISRAEAQRRRRRRRKERRREGEKREGEEKRGENIEQSSFFLCASASLREFLLIVLLREPFLAASQRVSTSFRGHTPFQVAIAAPDPKREAWILHGYEPQNDKETSLLEDERKRLGFDPITNPERLRGDRRREAQQEDRDMKLVVERLTTGDHDRERRCLERTPLTVLKDRGQATGLADYLGEVATRLLPLLDPGANTEAIKGADT